MLSSDKPDFDRLMKKRDIRGLNKALGHEDLDVVDKACTSLSILATQGIADPSSIPLIEGIARCSERLKICAVMTLGYLARANVSNSSSLPLLKEFLEGSNGPIRAEASVVIGDLALNGVYDASFIPSLNNALLSAKEHEGKLKENLIYALAGLAKNGVVDISTVPLLGTVLESGTSTYTKNNAVLIIALLSERGQMVPSALPVLKDALLFSDVQENHVLLRTNASYAMIRYASEGLLDEESIGLLKKAAESAMDGIRKNASIALEKLEGLKSSRVGDGYGMTLSEPFVELMKRSEDISALNKLLLDKEDKVRSNSAYAIGQLAERGRGEESSLGPLNGLLSDENKFVRSAAAYAIGFLAQISIGTRDSLQPLNDMLRIEDYYGQDMASNALGNLAEMGIGSKDSLLILIKLLDTNDSWFKSSVAHAISALAKMGIGDGKAIPLLNELIFDDNLLLKLYSILAIRNLAEIGICDASSIGLLEKMPDDVQMNDLVESTIKSIKHRLQ